MDSTAKSPRGSLLWIALSVLAILAWIIWLNSMYSRLPASLPVRWDIMGTPQAWAQKNVLVWVPLLLAFMLVAATAIQGQRRRWISHAERAFSFLGVCTILLAGAFVIEAARRNAQFAPPIVFPVAFGICSWLFSFPLQQLPYRSSWGMRTEASQATDEIWRQTHRTISLSMRIAGTAAVVIGYYAYFATGIQAGIALWLAGFVYAGFRARGLAQSPNP